MKTLVLLVHADPSVSRHYVDTLVDAGFKTADLTIRLLVGPALPGVPGGGLSSRYDALAQTCLQLGKGSAIRGLCAQQRLDLASYDRIFLATYSAGYAFARHLSAEDREMLDGLVLIDSGHTSKDPDGTASDSGIAWLVDWAKAARAGEKVLAIGHTDVDPVSYASTTQVAEEAVKLSGGPIEDLPLDTYELDSGCTRLRLAGRMLVAAFNRRAPADAKLEHGDALTVWGDELVRWAVSPPPLDLGALLAPFKPLQDVASVVADALPTFDGVNVHAHGYRCAVAELVADGRALGTYVPKATGRKPKVGDLLISARQGGDPEKGGPGHVERCSRIDADGTIWTIGGNESNRWIEARFDLSAPDYRGFIEVPSHDGELAVEFARAEMAAGVAEKPGAQQNERIQAYHAGARRGGSPLAGMQGHELEGTSTLGALAPDEIAWCASGACWCGYQGAA